VQAAWIELDVPQCGYCQAGQIMAAVSLLTQIAKPSEVEVNNSLSGNICRCAAYPRIRAAIRRASGQATGEIRVTRVGDG
jgi:isoquinoline 1-oxidoreductase alpha subunit